MLGQVDIPRRFASVDRRRFSAIDRMLPIIITGDCTHKSPLGITCFGKFITFIDKTKLPLSTLFEVPVRILVLYPVQNKPLVVGQTALGQWTAEGQADEFFPRQARK